MQTFENSTQTPYSCYVLNNEQVVGVLLVSNIDSQAEIEDICVHSTMRKQGIASKMIVRLCTELIQNGVDQLLLEVASNNTAAIRCYQKHGFAQTAVRRNYYKTTGRGKVDALLMHKRLAQ